MKYIIVLLLFNVCYGQNIVSVNQTGTVNASNSKWIPPTVTFAGLPGAPVTGTVYIVSDAVVAGSCGGGGGSNTPTYCRWNGSAWNAVGGGSGIACSIGTVSATTLQGLASGTSGEVSIQTGVLGTYRYDQVLVSETTQFVGGTGLTVSMGRTGPTNNSELTGTTVGLGVSSGDANYWSSRPIPPQLTTSYNLVLNFVVTSGNVNGVSAGLLTWEICGYASH